MDAVKREFTEECIFGPDNTVIRFVAQTGTCRFCGQSNMHGVSAADGYPFICHECVHYCKLNLKDSQ